MRAVKASYQLYINGVWQFGIPKLDSARQTARDLAQHKLLPVDIYKRVGRSESTDEFIETIKPVRFGGVK